MTDNKKFPKATNNQSINCSSSYEPWFASFGFHQSLSSNQLIIYKQNEKYQNANEIIPSIQKRFDDIYDITELEVFKFD